MNFTIIHTVTNIDISIFTNLRAIVPARVPVILLKLIVINPTLCDYVIFPLPLEFYHILIIIFVLILHIPIQPFYSRGYGLASVAENTTVTNKTMFVIASNTKSYLGVLLAKLLAMNKR